MAFLSPGTMAASIIHYHPVDGDRWNGLDRNPAIMVVRYCQVWALSWPCPRYGRHPLIFSPYLRYSSPEQRDSRAATWGAERWAGNQWPTVHVRIAREADN